MNRAILILALALVVCGCEGDERFIQKVEPPEIPSWLEERIEVWESGPRDRSPGIVSRYRFGFKDVIYIPPWCDDCFGDLRDLDGDLICHPDGGIRGDGDGQCPNFPEDASLLEVLWVDPRG